VRITVVTVVRNDPSVADTVASVLSQKGLSVESLVIDGASTDGTLAALAPFRRRARIVSAPDAGLYHAMNKGLRLAKGQVLGFLNAGDLFASQHALAAIAQAFEADRALDAAWGGLEIISAAGEIKRRWPAAPYQAGAFSRGWMPSHPSFYAKRQRLLRLKGFDTRYRLAADYDLMLRGLELGRWQGVAVPGTLVRMRSGGASQRSLGAWWQHNREAWLSARRAGVTAGTFPLFLAQKAGRKIGQLL
jgi:glycosyltransferase involved in cell wall biosynthesis